MKCGVRALAAFLVAGCAARQPTTPLEPVEHSLAAELDSATAGPEFARAQWGMIVQSLDNGQVLYRRNAERLFMPASNQKILTGAVALARLGAAFRWSTPVLARGRRRGDTLTGDLVVVGRGDPTISQHAAGGPDVLAVLRPWADSLRARGIRAITGRIVGDASWFPDPVLGEGWSWDDLPYSYSAPVGALQFNEGFAVLEVTPGERPGDTVHLRLDPSSAPLRVRSAAVTAPADSGVNTLDWTRIFFSDTVPLTGRLSAGLPARRFEVAVLDPTRYFERALGQVLAEAGIAILGGAGPRDSTVDTLFVWRSASLGEVLPLFEKPSQNQMGEALARTLGGALRGVASRDSGRAVVRETLRGWGVSDDAYVYVDGSGLSRYNYVTPRALALVLTAMARRPDSTVFREALPIAGVDGTLATRMRGTRAEGNVRAKTGTIANTRNISGYLTTRDGERLVFVLLANHFTVPSSVVTRTQDHIVERLANFSRAGR